MAPTKSKVCLFLALALLLASGEAQARHRKHHHHKAAAAAQVETAPSAAVAKSGDIDRLRQALAHRRDWATLRAAARSDANLQDLLQWLVVCDETSGASFDEIAGFLKNNPDWPRQRTIQSLAEKRMPRSLSAKAVQAWFQGREPVTGIGMVRLGEAEMALGGPAAARIQRAWQSQSFDRATELEILAAHQNILAQQVQDGRLAHLLYGSDEAAIRRQLARASQPAVHEATVRRQLQTSPRKGIAQYAGLPGSLKDDPGVMFDAAAALRQLGRTAEARRLLLRVTRSDEVPPLRLWSEIVLSARDGLKQGAYQETYDLVSRHHLERGEEFADAEFLAGWIALKYLSKPELALQHFQTLKKNVSRPISVARAEYWTGRALDALKKDDARAHYELAAHEPYTFYGQLALARIEARPVLRLASPPPEPAAANPLAKDGRAEAFRALAAAGARDLAREFALKIADDDDLTTAKAAALIRIANQSGDRALALKIAKHAQYQDVIVADALNPTAVPGVPDTSDALPIPKADVLALVRQESEFDPGSVSTAGARGLMQLMPAVAKQRAKALHLPYSPSRLTSDAQYNLRLGTTHFRAFFDAWGGSYVLAIASYNAGAGNVRKWIETYGDPRNPSVDVVDWIESIPFAETRNYVQRVVENLEVYRSLLGRQSLEILNTLYHADRIAPLTRVAQEVVRKPAPRHHRHKAAKVRRIVSAANELR